MTKRQKGKLSGGRVRQRKNEAAGCERDAGRMRKSKSEKKGESRNSGYKNRKCVEGVKTYRKKAEEVKYRNKSWAVYKEMSGGAAVWRY